MLRYVGMVKWYVDGARTGKVKSSQNTRIKYGDTKVGIPWFECGKLLRWDVTDLICQKG